MNVLMIHGIGQEATTEDELRDRWTRALHAVQPDLLQGATVRMAWYGTTLADWTNHRTQQAIGMGAETTAVDMADAGELQFLLTALDQLVKEQGISQAEIDAAVAAESGGVVPMGNALTRQLAGLMRIIEKISPAKGALLLRLVRQGHTYLTSPGAAKAVDDIVRPLLQQSPQVLITHSLGTVIAFKLLREMEAAGGTDVQIPLLITLGSPLALDAFKARLGPPRRKPASVARWENFYDRADFVTLGKPLDEQNFASQIGNDGSVNNTAWNAHAAVGYLPHPGVIAALREVL